jgi:tetratricopeptide (TPR) repeat protein
VQLQERIQSGSIEDLRADISRRLAEELDAFPDDLNLLPLDTLCVLARQVPPLGLPPLPNLVLQALHRRVPAAWGEVNTDNVKAIHWAISAIVPDAPSIRLALADLHSFDSEHEQVYAALAPIAAQSEDPLYIRRFADAAFRVGRFDEAVDAYTWLSSIQPENETVLRLRDRVTRLSQSGSGEADAFGTLLFELARALDAQDFHGAVRTLLTQPARPITDAEAERLVALGDAAIEESWSGNFGAFRQVLQKIAATGVDVASIEARLEAKRAEIRAARKEAGAKTRIFYFITWHQHPLTLARQLGAIYDEDNTYFISVGGQHPKSVIDALAYYATRPNVIIHNGAPNAWGGNRLLFENMFVAMDVFLARHAPGDWFQALCNRSFPLAPPHVVQERFATPLIARESVLPPPSYDDSLYKVEPAAFTQLHEFVSDGMRTGRMPDPDSLGMLSFNPTAISWNFDDRPADIGEQHVGETSRYMVMPHSIDMRVMGGARFVDFIDAVDDGRIYTRLMPRHAAQEVFAQLRDVRMFTGDPFIAASHRYVRFVRESQEARRLYFTMRGQFAPEMNFFDTLHRSERFGLRDEMFHPFYRPRSLELSDADIPRAAKAAQSCRVFTRKIGNNGDDSFARYFYEAIEDEMPETERRWTLSQRRVPPQLRSLRSLLALDHAQPVTVRDFLGNLRIDGTWHGDRIETVDGEVLAHVEQVDDGYDIQYPRWGLRHRYRRLAIEGGRPVLVPACVVSVRNNWARFIVFEPSAVAGADQQDLLFAATLNVQDGRLDGSDGLLLSARGEFGLMAASLLPAEERGRMPMFRPSVSNVRRVRRTDDGHTLILVESDGKLFTLRLQGVTTSHDMTALQFARATPAEAGILLAGDAGEKSLEAARLDRARLTERAWLLSSPRTAAPIRLRFRSDGTITDDAGAAHGIWRITGERLVLWNCGPWNFGEFHAVRLDRDRWSIAGYLQYSLAEDDAAVLVEEIEARAQPA